jgi:hypothetical protein
MCRLGRGPNAPVAGELRCPFSEGGGATMPGLPSGKRLAIVARKRLAGLAAPNCLLIRSNSLWR